jgi:hypothetical protein
MSATKTSPPEHQDRDGIAVLAARERVDVAIAYL